MRICTFLNLKKKLLEQVLSQVFGVVKQRAYFCVFLFFRNFMEKVLANPELAALYAKKFPSPKEKLDRSWDCNDYFPHYCDSDSILITLGDSLLFEAEHASPTED